jgi:hypothetical protein
MGFNKYWKVENEKLKPLSTIDEADYVLISSEEYNGIMTLYDMARKKSWKEVVKAKKCIADENGYTLKKSIYDSKQGNYRITKITPYSLNMPLVVVEKLVGKDLEQHYNYFPQKIKYEDDVGRERYIGAYEIVDFLEYGVMRRQGLSDDKNTQTVCQNWLQGRDRIITSFDISGGNLTAGRYEVTYAATKQI